LTDGAVDNIKLDQLTKGEFKATLEKLKANAKDQIKQQAEAKAKAEEEKKQADEKARVEAEQQQAQAEAVAQQQAQVAEQAPQATYSAPEASYQASAQPVQQQAPQAQAPQAPTPQAPATNNNGGYVYHTPTQEELNQSEREASTADYSKWYPHLKK
jgi:hypothetical protein